MKRQREKRQNDKRVINTYCLYLHNQFMNKKMYDKKAENQ